jgi:hypothetical protein
MGEKGAANKTGYSINVAIITGGSFGIGEALANGQKRKGGVKTWEKKERPTKQDIQSM